MTEIHNFTTEKRCQVPNYNLFQAVKVQEQTTAGTSSKTARSPCIDFAWARETILEYTVLLVRISSLQISSADLICDDVIPACNHMDP